MTKRIVLNKDNAQLFVDFLNSKYKCLQDMVSLVNNGAVAITNKQGDQLNKAMRCLENARKRVSDIVNNNDLSQGIAIGDGLMKAMFKFELEDSLIMEYADFEDIAEETEEKEGE